PATGTCSRSADGPAVHQRENGDVAERVDRVANSAPHADAAALAGHGPSLALRRRPAFKARARQRRRQPASSLVFVQVARLELHKVDLASLSHSVEMPGAEDCALAKVRPEVV